MTQYGINKGVKNFGKMGVAAVMKELQQLCNQRVGDPWKGSDLIEEERKRALKYLIFLKEKLDGIIKGRGCANGTPQHAYITKDKSSSPTISMEVLFMSCIIDTYEEQDVALVDVPGTFMQANMTGKTVHVKLEGEMARIMGSMDPRYKSMIEKE